MKRSEYWLHTGIIFLISLFGGALIISGANNYNDPVLIFIGSVVFITIGIWSLIIQYKRSVDISEKNGVFLFLAIMLTNFIIGIGWIILGCVPSEKKEEINAT